VCDLKIDKATSRIYPLVKTLETKKSKNTQTNTSHLRPHQKMNFVCPITTSDGIFHKDSFIHSKSNVPSNLNPNPTKHAQNQGERLSDRDFELAIEGIQRGLCGYIASITNHSSDRDDILQETNIFLWQRKSEFKSGTNFKAWVFKVAYFKAMGSRRDKVRRGEEVFSEDITQRIAAEAETYFDNRPDKFPALENCLKKLKPEEYQLLQEKYFKGNTITDFARQNKQSAGTILRKLSRIRHRLKACIEQQLTRN